eukprot:6058688-Amphidinium_carterae.1
MGFAHDKFEENDKGQLRMPSQAELKGRKILQAAAGLLHSLLLLENGDVLAFGDNSSRQCEVPRWAPGSRAVEVAAGLNHSLVLKREEKTRRGEMGERVGITHSQPCPSGNDIPEQLSRKQRGKRFQTIQKLNRGQTRVPECNAAQLARELAAQPSAPAPQHQ